MVDITSLNEALTTPNIDMAIDEARNRIINGECNVFDGVMETNDDYSIGVAG